MIFRALTVFFVLIGGHIFGQRNLLEKSQNYIRSFYRLSKEYSLQVDSVNDKTIILTYKTKEQYPYYTYEINIDEDLCVSYGIVSKESATLKAYLDLLDYIAELLEVDSSYSNFLYRIKCGNKFSYFSIKQPYFNSQFLTRRNLFYILVTEQTIETGDAIKEEEK